MPQMQLPIFPDGATNITSELAVKKEDGRVVYFNGHMPVFIHDENDLASFRMITSQFCVNGNARQADIIRVFGVPGITVKRAVRLYREKGPRGFFEPRKTRGAPVLTPAVIERVQTYLDQGLDVPEIAKKLDINRNTLQKAIQDGRLKKLHTSNNDDKKKAIIPVATSDESPSEEAKTTKSERNATDSEAPMGMGATNVLERVAACFGLLPDGASVQFQTALDVAHGGVLFALPALLVSGLLHHTDKHFSLPQGYYRVDSIFITLAFMALCRIKSIESLRYYPPGEWGNILGLDRIPEVRTLRKKIHHLATKCQSQEWSAELCVEWMAAAPDDAMVLYVDGHVRVYYGNQTTLPRHYVSRQRLCQRATTDYWVNAMDGQPFFVINKAVDPGLIKVLEQDIIPRLRKDVPSQPTNEQLAAKPLLHRFTIVFDREGYSPELFARLKQERIACLTYNKFPKEDWHLDEFQPISVSLVSGEVVEMMLAERGTRLSNDLWVREVRKLTASGHQTSILTTDYCTIIQPIAGQMFARWSQENFFRYMRQHFGLDKLTDHQTEEIPDTTRVVNPAYRELDGEVRKKAAKLGRKLAEFGAMGLCEEIEPKKMKIYENKKMTLQEEIEYMKQDLEQLKAQRKATERHITISQLPEEERFKQLSTDSKHFLDTIKMIAYRAETAMACIINEKMSRSEDVRSLLRAIYRTETDIIPDEAKGVLIIRLHQLANHSNDGAILHLCQELNATGTLFPGTNLRLVYELGSFHFPRDQDS